MAVVCFINKWGKIRRLEPYRPSYRRKVYCSRCPTIEQGGSEEGLAQCEHVHHGHVLTRSQTLQSQRSHPPLLRGVTVYPQDSSDIFTIETAIQTDDSQTWLATAATVSAASSSLPDREMNTYGVPETYPCLVSTVV